MEKKEFLTLILSTALAAFLGSFLAFWILVGAPKNKIMIMPPPPVMFGPPSGMAGPKGPKGIAPQPPMHSGMQGPSPNNVSPLAGPNQGPKPPVPHNNK